MDLKDDEHLKYIIESAPIGIAVLEASTLVVKALNNKFLEISGKPKEAIVDKWYWEPFAQTRHLYEEALNNAVASGKTYYADEVKLMRTHHGREESFYATFVYAPIKNEAGQISKVAVWVLENTAHVVERKKAEAAKAAFQQERDRLKSFFMQAPAGICILDGPELIYELVNPSYQNLLPGRNLLGRPIFEALPELVGTPLEHILKGVYHTGEDFRINELLIPVSLYEGGPTQDRYFTFNYTARKNQENQTDGILAFVYEVTAIAKNAQQQQTTNEKLTTLNQELTSANQTLNSTQDNLQDVNQRLNIALDAGKFGITEVDLATGKMSCNDRFKNLFGRSKEQQMVYSDMFEAMLPEYREDIRARSKKAQAEGLLYEATYEIKWPDGSIHWIEAHGRARYDRFGNAERMVGILADVTEQVNARTQLEQAEAKLRLATEAAALGTWYINAETLEFIPSARLKELFDYNPEDIMPYDAAVSQIAESHRKQVTDAVDAAIKEGKSYDIEYPIIGYNDHKLRWVRATGRLFEARGGESAHFSGAMLDISEQITALNVILESEDRYRKIAEELEISRDETQLAIDAASLATFDLNPQTGKFKGNRLIKEWFGLQPDEEIELEKATDVIADADRERVINAIQDALSYELGGHYEISYTIVSPLNSQPRIVKAKGRTLFNELNQPIRLSGVLQDITEQHLDEQRKNDFIAMVSHELKTPLTSLSAYIQMLQLITKKQEDQKLIDMLEKSNAQVRKMNTMINGFLDISRFESGKIHLEKQQFLLNGLLDEMVSDALLISASHQIVFSHCGQVSVNADRDKIGQVVTNLLSNAVKYSAKGTKITVRCGRENNLATVSISDEGVGIGESDSEKLFDRFYRVGGKQAETISGFGIGLYLSAEIIQRHHGEIGVKSQPGKGSTFYFKIPLINAQ